MECGPGNRFCGIEHNPAYQVNPIWIRKVQRIRRLGIFGELTSSRCTEQPFHVAIALYERR